MRTAKILVPDPGSVLLLRSTLPHTTDVEYTTHPCAVQAALSKIGGQMPEMGHFEQRKPCGNICIKTSLRLIGNSIANQPG